MRDEPKDSAPRAPANPPMIASETLFGEGRQLIIVHHGERYVLRITRQGKLILNK